MKLIGLTGSICSGKSTVLALFKKQGFAVLDADSIVAGLYRKKPVKKRLDALFGTHSKKAISNIAFSSPKKRRALESALHPLAKKQLLKELALFRGQGKRAAVVAVPLLFESGWHRLFDSVIVVKAPRRQCLARAMKSGLSKKDFLLRWHAQLSQRKKIKRAHYTIDNAGSLAKTRAQVGGLSAELLG
ncbi:MAG: dephospho-CoA kinase [Candidatus Diapherotrites archaeon]|uniref:Dephospho-CoA kinase n=1 Tax=Candidatus Iainarchaeum sp. TaxID=3101447 RepID=A0A939C6A2_9ARCH|nr:dephospho-CoA kinase [Candidatus Diapherotrites archaeon]